MVLAALAAALALAACGSGGAGAPAPDPCLDVGCSGHGTCAAAGGRAVCACDPGYQRVALTACEPTALPTIAGCQILPADHLFNTPIDDLPVHPSSATWLASIGSANLHLDLGRTTDMASDAYYGIPWNVVHGDVLAWPQVRFTSVDTVNMDWDPLPESDCASGGPTGAHAVASPCLASAVPAPRVPLPAAPLVEGGVVTDPAQPYGDHHILLLDADACRLWELYHCYPNGLGSWDVFGSATFDLASSALRPSGWTSADAAGFPILPLLLRADEASSGAIRHALRFTILSSTIRASFTWPARHKTGTRTSAALPEMGQLFRLKASYAIPASFTIQARAILQAMKTYGMYVADGGSRWYVTGEPSAAWQDATISQVGSVGSGNFEAVDLAPIRARTGWREDSAAVPPP